MKNLFVLALIAILAMITQQHYFEEPSHFRGRGGKGGKGGRGGRGGRGKWSNRANLGL